MKIILQKDIPKLGKEGEVKNVADGYAQNYLIKNRLAILCTPSAFQAIEQAQTKRKVQKEKEFTQQQVLTSQLKKTIITAKLKTGKDGGIFNSVSIPTILSLLKEQGIKLEKVQIILPRPIKTLGEHKIKILITNNIETELLLRIEKE